MPSSYKYQPLSSPATQIRLLELLPGRGIIQCRLKVANLEDAQGTYEPISYCWKTYSREHWWGGSYKEKKKQKEFQVLVDGSDLLITESLQAALRHMRLETEVRVLWADAICINQADDEEKSAQVSMMGKIYKSGSRTIVWLGDADFWTRTAFKHMRRTRPTPGRTGRAAGQGSGDSNSTGYSTDGDHHQLESANEGGMARLSRYRRQITALSRDTFIFFVYRSIANRPYFNRAWIVQEVVLSDSIVVVCGKHEATGKKLYNWLCDDDWLSGTASGVIRYSIVDLWDNLQIYDLDCIISKLSHMKTSDPRDKLYSALSLHQDYIDDGSITVDYSKTADEVFLDATKVLLSRSPFLDLLSISYGTARPGGKHIPSWVWNPETRSTEFHLSWTASHATRPFRATRGSHSQAQFQDRKLGLRGYIFDNVRKVGGVLSASSSALWSHHETREAIRCYCSWINVCGLDKQEITEAEATGLMQSFRRTLKPLIEKFTPAEEWPEHDEYNAAYFLLFHTEIMKRFGRFFTPETPDKATRRSRLGLWATVEAFRLLPLFQPECLIFFHDWHTKAMVGRCVVLTDTGRYALCPGGTMPGDRLCLLQGANVPIVLRPSGENWTLVGECYTEGAMYGELWDPDRCEPLWVE